MKDYQEDLWTNLYSFTVRVFKYTSDFHTNEVLSIGKEMRKLSLSMIMGLTNINMFNEIKSNYENYKFLLIGCFKMNTLLSLCKELDLIQKESYDIFEQDLKEIIKHVKVKLRHATNKIKLISKDKMYAYRNSFR